MKNYVVLGGGTAGWLTALFVKKCFPGANVTVVQSEDIGIIGVGEATTPHLITAFRALDIDYREVLKETNGTIKNGISFENWNGDGKKYFHGFTERLVDFYVPNIFGGDCFSYYLKSLVNDKLDFNEYVYAAKLSYENKVDVTNLNFAIHFDANLLAKFFQKVGTSRNIKVVEGKFKNVETDADGFIRKLVLEDGMVLPVDFIFDCTGFSRLLIGKHFNVQWKSYKDYLPMKKAIPFPHEHDGVIHPYTNAVAMKYGWCWQIPLQHRLGTGYIFDSDYIDEEQALEEAKQTFGRDLKVNRVISFEAGRYEKYWVKNCMAVGLSSSFIEPLESTSIFLTINQLTCTTHFLNEFTRCDQKSIDHFNQICADMMDDALNVVYLHYVTKRCDTPFWQEIKHKYKTPPKFIEVLNKLKEANIRPYDLAKPLLAFELYSYLEICQGLDLFEKPFSNSCYTTVPNTNEYKKIIDREVKNATSHADFLKAL